MGAVLIASLAVQAHTCPWRTARANLVDLLLTAFLLVILLGAAPLLKMEDDESTAVLGWLLCIPVLAILVAALLALLKTAISSFQNRHLYGIFLCHHKGGSGSLCRLMKILIARHSSTRVFLDCDQLENLDYLFDIVRTATRSVVVVLTPELLRRVWCAGEIATAWKNRITTVPLVCDGFHALSDEAQKLIPTLWTPQQKQILANYGVEIDAVNGAYAWLQHELTALEMPRFGAARRLEMWLRGGRVSQHPDLTCPEHRTREGSEGLHGTYAATLHPRSLAERARFSRCFVGVAWLLPCDRTLVSSSPRAPHRASRQGLAF